MTNRLRVLGNLQTVCFDLKVPRPRPGDPVISDAISSGAI